MKGLSAIVSSSVVADTVSATTEENQDIVTTGDNNADIEEEVVDIDVEVQLQKFQSTLVTLPDEKKKEVLDFYVNKCFLAWVLYGR